MADLGATSVSTLLKFVLIVAIAAGAMFEVGSPLWSRSDAAGAAQDAANAAVRNYFDTANLDTAKTAASAAAAVRGTTLTTMQLQANGDITVTVTRQAPSYVLHRISALKNWYNVTATATAAPIRA
jgi:Flp pilus assembly protein TadG